MTRSAAAADPAVLRPGAAVTLADSLAGGLCLIAVTLWAAGAFGYEAALALGLGIGGLSLATLAAWAGFLALALALLPGSGLVSARDPAGAGWLALLAAIGALLALTAFRPDLDDSYYVPNVLWALSNPDQAVTADVHALSAAPLAPFVSPHWAQAVGYDYLGGALAWAAGAELLDIRYVWLTGFAGAVTVAGLFLFLRRLDLETGAALWATLLYLTLLVIWRESHRDPGNFAFVRIFQGKSVVMTALLPLFAAVLIGFLRTPFAGTRRIRALGFAVFLTALAGAGMTASSVFLMGGMAVALVLGLLAAEPRRAGPLIVSALIAALLCLPLAVPALRALTDTLPLGGTGSPANEGWPATFLGHVRFMGKGTWVLLVLCLGALLVFGRSGPAVSRPAFRLVLGWTLAVIVLFANPVTGQILIDHALGPNAYWRIFYTLPWAGLAGLAGLAVIGRLPAPVARRRGPVLAMIFVLAAGGMAAYDAAKGYPPDLPPGWKLPHEAVGEAQAVIAAAPPGPMLAPYDISPYVPSLSARHPQLRMRTSGLRVWALAAGHPEMADRRVLAATLLGTNADPGKDSGDGKYLEKRGDAVDTATQARALAQVLEESRPASVVQRSDGAAAAAAREVLAAAGYEPGPAAGNYLVWVRPGT